MEQAGKIFILQLDDRRFALQLAAVERVVRMVEITPLPHAPDPVLGIINLQGTVVPVLDLRRRFRMAPRAAAVSDYLVVVQGMGRPVALVADSAGEIVDAPGLSPLDGSELISCATGCLATVLKTAQGLVPFFEVQCLLSPDERQQLGEWPCLPEGGGELPPPSGSRDPQEARVLRERAVRLAQEPDFETAAHDRMEVVHFTLGAERYGIESLHVREVYPYRDLVRLPGVPEFLLGIISVRGKIHSVLDLRRLFELPGQGAAPFSKVIILQSPRMVFGILADSILGVGNVPVAELQPPLSTFSGIRGAYVRGVTADGLTLLDGAKILSDNKLVVHREL